MKGQLNFLLFIGLFCISTLAKAQTFTITPVNTSFSVANATQVTNSSTISGSFKLNITSFGTAAIGYDITAWVTPMTPQVFPTVPLQVKLVGVSGVATTGGVTGNIPLVESPGTATLATNANRTGNNKTAVWTYDLILTPIGYSIPPGTYTYTVNVRVASGITTIDKTFNVTITVGTVVTLGMTQNISPNYTFANITNYNNGVTYSNINTFDVNANKPWLFTIKSSTDFFSLGGVPSDLPSSVLSATVSTTTVNISTTDAQLKAGNAGNSSVAGNSFNMNLKANPGYLYSPGTYTINLVYTLTAQ